MGTGGAIVHALKEHDGKPVLVINGDTLLDIDYGELIHWYRQKPTQIAMVLREVPDVSRYGAVLLSGEQVVGFQEKGSIGSGLINAGVYIIQPDIFDQWMIEFVLLMY